MKLKLAIDTSHHEDKPFDYVKIAESGVILACTKATQGDFYKDDKMVYHLTEAKKARIAAGTYHFHEPGNNPTAQIFYYLDWLKENQVVMGKPDFHILDVERQWEWQYKSIGKKKAKSWQQVNVGADELNARIRTSWDVLNAKTAEPKMIYTRKTWLDEYCPKMWDWIKDLPLMLAQYPDSHQRVDMTPEAEKAWLDDMTNRVSLLGQPAKGKATNVLIWQFSEYYKGAGYGNPTDLSFVLDEARLRRWLGSTQGQTPVEPDPQPGELVTLASLNIRLEKVERSIIKSGIEIA